MRVRDVLPKHMVDKIPIIGENETKIFRLIVDQATFSRFTEDGKGVPSVPKYATSDQCSVYDPKTKRSYIIGNVTGERPINKTVDGQDRLVMSPMLECVDFGHSGVRMLGHSDQEVFDYLFVYPVCRSNPFRDTSKKPKFYLEDAKEDLKIMIKDQELEDDAILLLKGATREEVLSILEGLPEVMKNKLTHNVNPEVLKANLRDLVRKGQYEAILKASDNKDFKRKVQIAEAEGWNIIVRDNNKRTWADEAGKVILDVEPDKEMLTSLNEFFQTQKGHEVYISVVTKLDELKRR